MVGIITVNGETLNLVQMEAKAPTTKKGYVDFVKLGNTTKLSLDELVSRGISLELVRS